VKLNSTVLPFAPNGLPENNLGGWHRSLDLIFEPVALFDGLLTMVLKTLCAASGLCLFGKVLQSKEADSLTGWMVFD
jgi:hypothetical protein